MTDTASRRTRASDWEMNNLQNFPESYSKIWIFRPEWRQRCFSSVGGCALRLSMSISQRVLMPLTQNFVARPRQNTNDNQILTIFFSDNLFKNRSCLVFFSMKNKPARTLWHVKNRKKKQQDAWNSANSEHKSPTIEHVLKCKIH